MRPTKRAFRHGRGGRGYKRRRCSAPCTASFQRSAEAAARYPRRANDPIFGREGEATRIARLLHRPRRYPAEETFDHGPAERPEIIAPGKRVVRIAEQVRFGRHCFGILHRQEELVDMPERQAGGGMKMIVDPRREKDVAPRQYVGRDGDNNRTRFDRSFVGSNSHR